MSKDLIIKCESIIKKHVVDNTITYKKLCEELNKNKNFRTTTQHLNAVEYLKSKSINIIDESEASIDTSNKREIFNLDDHEYLQYLTELANENNSRAIDISLIQVHFTDSYKCKKAIDFLTSLGYKIETFEYEDKEEDILLEKSEDESRISNNYLITDGVRQYLTDIGKIPLLSSEEEFELFTKYKETNDSHIKETIANCNLKLVVSIAKYYVNKCELAFLDIIQHGNIGLLIAIDRFEPERGYKFSTYATYWIRQSILRGIGNDCRTIRLPIHASEQALRNKRARIALKDILGRDPSNEELLDYINENKLYAHSVKYMTMENLLLYERCYEDQTVSLNKPVGEETDSESCLMDFIESEEDSPEEAAEKNYLRETIRDAVQEALSKYNSYNPRELEIIYLRFGIYDNTPRTLQEIADMYGVSRERIRQIETKVIKKLRRSATFRRRLGNYVV